MPPLPLVQILVTALSPVSSGARAVVDVLACKNGLLPAAGDVATFVGLRSRHQVARALRRAGLPPLEELAGWTRLFHWVLQAEQTGASLLALAREADLEPATCYRLVRRLMGEPWSRVRRGGIAAAIRRYQTIWKKQGGTVRVARKEAPPAHSTTRAALDVRPIAHPPVAPRQPRGILAGVLPVAGYPFDVAIAPDGTAWLTRTHAAVLERIRTEPLESLGGIPVGVAPTRIALARSGERAWVTNQFTKDVSVVDLVRRCRSGSIAIEGDPLGATISPDSRFLYVTTNFDRLCACALTENGGRVVRSTSLSQACVEVAIHPAGNRLYVPTWRAGTILEFDARSLTLVRRFDVGGRPLGIALSQDGLRLYAGNEGGWLDVVHLATGRQVRRPLGTTVAEVALTPDQSVVYVSLRVAGRVSLLDAHSLESLGTLETGGLPRHVAFDASQGLALIANEAGWVDLVR